MQSGDKIFVTRYDLDNDIIAFDDFLDSYTWEFSPMFQAGTEPLSTYKTANARTAVISSVASKFFLFACVNVDDGGSSQDVVFSRINYATNDLLTLTVENRWANCIVGASTDEDKASFLMKDQNFFYFAEVNFATSDVTWKKSNELKFFAGGVNTFRTVGQYLKFNEKEDWFFVGLTNQIASAKFNYPVGIVVSTESDSRINDFWRSESSISPSSYSDDLGLNLNPQGLEVLSLSASSPTIEAFSEEHEDLAHNYWMRDTSCGVGN